MKRTLILPTLCLSLSVSFLTAYASEEAIINMTAAEIVQEFVDAGYPIDNVIVYDEKTDWNGLLGRPGQYTSKVNFADIRCDQYDSEDPVGGTVEVFENAEDAQARYDYVESYSSLAKQYFYLQDNVFMRISYDLIPSEATKYEAGLIAIANESDVVAFEEERLTESIENPQVVSTEAFDLYSSNEYDNLPNEYDLLMNNYNSLATQYTTLQSNYDSLLLEKEALQSEYNALFTEKESLQSKYDSLLATHEQCNIEPGSVETEPQTDSIPDVVDMLQRKLSGVEKNTNDALEKIIEMAKSDSSSISESQLNNAITAIRDNYPQYYNGSECMELYLYYGYLLDFSFDDSDPRSELGMDVCQAIKYVYRNVETVLDPSTKANLNQIEEDLQYIP